MARALEEAKRQALLAAATDLVATLGTAAPTAQIAKKAGVAEGTLFLYFPNKAKLMAELYLTLNLESRAAVSEALPADASAETLFHHFWDRLIDWGLKHPNKRRALRQLRVSELVPLAKQRAEVDLRGDVEHALDWVLATGVVKDQPIYFTAAVMEALADVVLELASQDPKKLRDFRELGWRSLWGAIRTQD